MFKLSKIDFVIDNSELYDFELVNDVVNKDIDIILDFSVYYDFDLVRDTSNNEIDIILDFSVYYDFELSDAEIDVDKLISMTPICVDCDSIITALNGEYSFLLNDDYEYLITSDGCFLQYH
jgi:hypothetical protein